MKPIILIDIDGTLADDVWRHNLRPDWDSYHAAAKDDEPHLPLVQFLNAAASHFLIVAITTRPEKWRKLTMEWLIKHNIPIHDLIMRPDDNYQTSPALKLALAFENFNKESITLVIDDRDDVLTAFRAEGIATLQTVIP